MPFTPFHFGPGILVNAFGLRWFWLTSFVAANLLIDVEVLYYLVRKEFPLHRHLHTYLGGTGMGVLAGLLMFGVAMLLRRTVSLDRSWIKRLNETPPRRLMMESVATGIIGGVTHIFLDSLMHRDMDPYWPWSTGNALAGAVGVGVLHMSLALMGFFGLVLWLLMKEE